MVRRILRITGITAGILAGIIAVLLVYISLSWDKSVERPVATLTAPTDSASVARGAFLFQKSLTCWACHGEGSSTAPPAGGREFDLTLLSPSLGMYHVPNITPDRETGIGDWTDGEIVRAIREGIRKNGKVLFPVMPVDVLRGLSDEDVLAIVAYLRSLAPVKNPVPPREPSLFTKALFTFGVLAPSPEIKQPIIAPPRANTREYGEYVARHASLCVDCHTPRNLKDGSFYYDSLLAGSSLSFGELENEPVRAWAANLTPDKETGIGNWTEEQFITMLRTGTGPDGRVRTGHMPYSFYSLWDSIDVQAVFTYLRSVPPVRRVVGKVEHVGDAASPDPSTKGRALFDAYCMPCHGKEGSGELPTSVRMADVAPSLSDWELAEFITAGNPGLRMPSFAKTFSTTEIEAIVAHIRSWKQ